jgi:hypothetical protein
VGGEIFPACPDRPWSPPSLLYNGYRVSFLGVNRPGRGVEHPTPSDVEVKGNSGAIPLLPLWIFVACSKVKFYFTFYAPPKLFVTWYGVTYRETRVLKNVVSSTTDRCSTMYRVYMFSECVIICSFVVNSFHLFMKGRNYIQKKAKKE